MKKLITSFVCLLLVGFGLKASAEVLILTEDLNPGDFSLEVVDLQNFFNRDVDTQVNPSKIGEFGIETINATARFQNKYQRTILGPFKRLATGNVEVMTRFKIAVLGIKAEPESLRDATNRSKLSILLAQTIEVLNAEIDRRNGLEVNSDILTYQGKRVPEDVANGVPGRYEISETEGFYVDDFGQKFHYSLPETNIEKPTQFRTFSDLYQSYDYLTEVEKGIKVTPLEEDLFNQIQSSSSFTPTTSSLETTSTVAVNSNYTLPPEAISLVSADQAKNLNNVQVFQVPTAYTVDNSTYPIVMSTLQYAHRVGNTIRIFGRNFDANTVISMTQGSNTSVVSTSYKSPTEVTARIPSSFRTGNAIVAVNNVPHSAVEIFTINSSECNKHDGNCERVNLYRVAEGDVVFDTEITLKGDDFEAKNTVETSFGVYYDVPRVDDDTLKLTIKYPFVVSEDTNVGHDIPFGIRVSNVNGTSEFIQVKGVYKKEITLPAQKAAGVTRKGDQATNPLLVGYLESKGQKVEKSLFESQVHRVRAVISEEAFKDIQGTPGISLFSSLEEKTDNFFGYITDAFKNIIDRAGEFFAKLTAPEEAVASTIPYNGYVTATFPCTCSANWYVMVVGAYGAYPLVIQPGYTLLWSYYDPFRPGAGLVGSFTPITGTCWVYAGVTCVVIPTIGVMDPFPGTGTTL